jgi:hypothetical protein
MTKHAVLAHLADVDVGDAEDFASAFDISYPAAAMALLRLVRQGLASRSVDPSEGRYTYRLTDHGYARLAFFDDIGSTRASSMPARSSPLPNGGSVMKRKKLHTGVYHCPVCFIELDLMAEESLKCDQCGGPLNKGSLDEIWDDDDADQDD